MDNIGVITTALAGLGGWFFGTKKRAAENMTTQSNALDAMQKAYDTFVEDSKQQYTNIREQMKVLEERERDGLKERANMQGRIEEMGKQITGYEATIAALRKEVSEYEHTVKELKAELAKYKNEKEPAQY